MPNVLQYLRNLPETIRVRHSAVRAVVEIWCNKKDVKKLQDKIKRDVPQYLFSQMSFIIKEL